MKPNYRILLRNGIAYIHRWYLLPYSIGRRIGNIYFHKTMVDDYPTLHDHPYAWNISIVLWGGYYETTPIDRFDNRNVYHRGTVTKWHGPGSIIFRGRLYPHRLSLTHIRGDVNKRKFSYSLFVCGPVRQDWGFHTRLGWMSHKKLITIVDGVSQATPEGEELLK